MIGSGPGGAAVAHEFWRTGKRVVLIERGPFVVWGSMDTRSYSRLMFQENNASTTNNAVVIRSGQTLGGGSTVNIDLAFSPLEATCQARIDEWRKLGLIDSEFYTPDRIAAAYQWVREVIQTRELSQTELNQDNLAVWDGAKGFGVDPSLYHLNRFAENESPSPVERQAGCGASVDRPGRGVHRQSLERDPGRPHQRDPIRADPGRPEYPRPA